MLIFSGVRRTYRRMRPEVPLTRDEHDLQPVHRHVSPGNDGEGVGLAVTEDISVSEWHHGHHGHPGHHHHKHPEPDEPFMNYGRATAFVVGMVHGIGAETPTQILIFLAAAGAGGKTTGEVVLVAFIVGLLTSNSLITFASSVGYIRASENWRVYATIAILTATFSLVIGSLFLFGKASVAPGALRRMSQSGSVIAGMRNGGHYCTGSRTQLRSWFGVPCSRGRNVPGSCSCRERAVRPS